MLVLDRSKLRATRLLGAVSLTALAAVGAQKDQKPPQAARPLVKDRRCIESSG